MTMTDYAAEVEAARAKVQQQFDAARTRHALLRSAIDGAEGATGTARSSRGEVTVIAGADGTIRSVVFADAHVPASTLGPLVTGTIAEAQQAAREAAADRIAEAVGDDASIVTQLRTPRGGDDRVR
jgi:hypothetical protein